MGNPTWAWLKAERKHSDAVRTWLNREPFDGLTWAERVQGRPAPIQHRNRAARRAMLKHLRKAS